MVKSKTPVLDTFKILCPFCNVPYTADMEQHYLGGSSGCDTCGYGSYTETKVTITCSNCKRVVYEKEGRTDD